MKTFSDLYLRINFLIRSNFTQMPIRIKSQTNNILDLNVEIKLTTHLTLVKKVVNLK